MRLKCACVEVGLGYGEGTHPAVIADREAAALLLRSQKAASTAAAAAASAAAASGAEEMHKRCARAPAAYTQAFSDRQQSRSRNSEAEAADPPVRVHARFPPPASSVRLSPLARDCHFFAVVPIAQLTGVWARARAHAGERIARRPPTVHQGELAALFSSKGSSGNLKVP